MSDNKSNENNDDITIESEKEKIAEYFVSHFNLKKDIQNVIIKEDISGEILPELDDNDYKSLGINFGPKKKIKDYLNRNKDKFIPKQIQIIVDTNSTPEKVKSFFEEYLSFKGSLNNMNGKKMLELSTKEMKEMNLNLGQIKKLCKYIEFVKKNGEKNPKNTINQKSTKEEISQYLKEELHFSDEEIEELELDIESLKILEVGDIDECNCLSEEKKEKLKKFLIDFKESLKIGGINSDKDCNDINDNTNGPTNSQKGKKEQENYKNIISDKKESMEDQSLTNNQERDNNKYNNTSKNNNINITKENEEFKQDNKTNDIQKKYSTGTHGYDESDIEKEKKEDHIRNNSSNINEKKNNTITKKEYPGTIERNYYFNEMKQYKIHPIIKDSKYNVFFILIINEKYINNLGLSTYFIPNDKTLIYFYHHFLYEKKIKNDDFKYILVQVPISKNNYGILKVSLEIKRVINYYNKLYSIKDYFDSNI